LQLELARVRIINLNLFTKTRQERVKISGSDTSEGLITQPNHRSQAARTDTAYSLQHKYQILGGLLGGNAKYSRKMSQEGSRAFNVTGSTLTDLNLMSATRAETESSIKRSRADHLAERYA
jgi:hypothetical protein